MNLGSRPSVPLRVKTKIVFGGNAVASSLDSKANCAGFVMPSASSIRTRCIRPSVIGI
jgi:hypothetical protein